MVAFPHTVVPRLLAAVAASAAILVSLPGQAFDLNKAMFNSDTAFSGTQTTTVKKDTVVMEVFKEGKKMRMDMNEQGQSVSVIVRMDKETNYMLMHSMNMYQEMKSKQIKQYQKDLTMQFTNQQQAGTEEANGFKCTKYTADFKDNDGSKGSGSYWVNSDEIIVRAVMTSKRRFKTTETTMNITNLKVGDQPDELFEVPAGYSSMGLGALMGNAFGKSQEDAPEAHSGDQPKTDDPEQQSANDGAAADNAVKNVRNALKGLFNRNKN